MRKYEKLNGDFYYTLSSETVKKKRATFERFYYIGYKNRWYAYYRTDDGKTYGIQTSIRVDELDTKGKKYQNKDLIVFLNSKDKVIKLDLVDKEK